MFHKLHVLGMNDENRARGLDDHRCLVRKKTKRLAIGWRSSSLALKKILFAV